jgi:hypothetical protein
MHEYWLQKYIKEHYQQIGFTQIHGPYKHGADFKGFFAGKPVKIEAEWDYSDYIDHEHALDFADILVVGTYDPVPERLRERLPSTIIHLDRDRVIEWAEPRQIKKHKEDYTAYPWRRLSRSLIDLYAYYRKVNQVELDFIGSDLAFSKHKSPTPPGFTFGSGGKEESFTGSPENKISWDYWLVIAHSVASHFHLSPALLRPTWIDRVGLYFNHAGNVTDGELKRFEEVATFVDEIIRRGEP